MSNYISLESNAKEIENAGSADAIIVPEPTFIQTERILHRHQIWSVKASKGQSELTLTFGLGRREKADRIVIEWPGASVQEHKNVGAGAYNCVEGKSISAQPRV